jgi:hypothetical protein
LLRNCPASVIAPFIELEASSCAVVVVVVFALVEVLLWFSVEFVCVGVVSAGVVVALEVAVVKVLWFAVEFVWPYTEFKKAKVLIDTVPKINKIPKTICISFLHFVLFIGLQFQIHAYILILIHLIS